MTTGLMTTTRRDELMNKVNQKLNTLEEVKITSMKTSGMLPWSFENKSQFKINIHETTKVDILIRCGANVKIHEKAYIEYCEKTLQLKSFPQFKWNGYTTEEWNHDIKARIVMLQYNEQKEILKNAQSELEKLLTEEERRVLAIKRIEEAIG